MSLNRAEWLEMWECTRQIMLVTNRLTTTNIIAARKIDDEIKEIRFRIQQVIGQME